MDEIGLFLSEKDRLMLVKEGIKMINRIDQGDVKKGRRIKAEKIKNRLDKVR